MAASAPLPSDLWHVLKALEQAYAAEGAPGERMPPLDLWANLLRAVNENPTSLRALPATLRLSKRAVNSRITTASRCGWIEELRLGKGDVTVRLTQRGLEMAARWNALQSAAEKRWQKRVGADNAARFRSSIEAIVRLFSLEHPHYPAGYGAADARITGGNGRDWKAVPREAGDSVSNLPLSALVSQTLVAFAMDYEERSPVALSLSTAVIKRIPADGRPLHEFGDSAGVSALIRHGFLRVSGNGRSKTVFLTPRGLSVNEAYDGRIRGVEAAWRARFGNESVSTLRRALEEVR